jgi:hypothetical protein
MVGVPWDLTAAQEEVQIQKVQEGRRKNLSLISNS